jgi:hypothetical protein
MANKDSGAGGSATEDAGESALGCFGGAAWSVSKQHFLYFLPLPHGQGSFRPIFMGPSLMRMQLSLPDARGGKSATTIDHGRVQNVPDDIIQRVPVVQRQMAT